MQPLHHQAPVHGHFMRPSYNNATVPHMQCKHQLAAKLAAVLRRCCVTRVPDDVLARFLMEQQ
jgi:hypothetical protein